MCHIYLILLKFKINLVFNSICCDLKVFQFKTGMETGKEERSDNSDLQSESLSLCKKISKHIGGLICLIVMVIDWVAYAEVNILLIIFECFK